MGRELRLFIRLLRNAPHNPVFRSTLAGRNACTMMIALLILAIAHVGVLEWIERSPMLRFSELSGFVSRLTWHSLLLPFMLMACVLGIRRGISLDQRRELWLTVQSPREVAFGALLAPALFMALFAVVIPLLIAVLSVVENRLWWQGFARDLLQMGLIVLLEEFSRELMESRSWEFKVFFSLWVVVAYVAYAGLLSALLLGTLVRCRMPVWIEFLRIPVHTALVQVLVFIGCGFSFDVMVDVVNHRRLAVTLAFVTLGFMGIWSLFALAGSLLGFFHGVTYGAGRRWFVEAIPDLGRGKDWFESEWIVQESASRGIPRALLEWLFPYTWWELSQAAVRAVMGAAFGALLIAIAFISPWGLSHQTQNAGLNRIVVITAICLLAAALFTFPRKPLILPSRPLHPIAGRLLPSMVLTSFVASLVAFAIANVCWFLAAPDRAAFLADVHDNRLILLIAYASMLVVTTLLMMGLNLLLQIQATCRWAKLLVVANLLLLVVPMVFTTRLLVLACVSIGTATLLGLACYMMLGGGRMLLQMIHDDEARSLPMPAGHRRRRRPLVIGKLLHLLRLLRKAPANPVFRLVAYSRHGRMARLAVWIILLVEVGFLIWLTRHAGARYSGWDYLTTTLGYHALMMPLLLVMTVWAFSRPFTAAQKEDLWLTHIPPREVAFGAVLMPALAALMVILLVPAILCLFGLAFYLFDFIPWAMDILTGEAQRRRSTGIFVIFSVWFELYLYGACAVIYLCTGLVAMRWLLVSLLRTRGVTLVASVRALFAAAIAGAMAFQMLLFTIFLLEPDRWPHSESIFIIIHNVLLMIVMPLSLIAGMVIGLGHHPARRWFAEAVSSNMDDWDWLASETSMVSQPEPHHLRMTSPLSARLLAILPRVAISTIVGAIFAATMLAINDSRRAMLHVSYPSSGENMMIAALLLASLMGALLAFRDGWFLSWRRPIPIAKGRIAGSVWGAAIVAGLFGHVPLFFWIAASQGAFSITLTSIFPVTAFALVTMLPVMMLYCMLLCLWRLRATRRWTTIGVVFTIISLSLCLWIPTDTASAFVDAFLMLPPTALAFFWLGGGSEWMYQMVFDQERALPMTAVEGEIP